MSSKFRKKKSKFSDKLNIYVNVMKLLLCFFVFFFIFANVAPKKYNDLHQSFNNYTKVSSNVEEQIPPINPYQATWRKISNNVQGYIKKNNLNKIININNDNDKITINFNSTTVQDNEDVVIKEAAKIILYK